MPRIAGDWAGDYGRVAEAVKRAATLPRSGDDRDALLTDMLIGVGSFLEGASAREVDRVRGVVDRADDFDEPIWLLWAAWGAGAIGDDERAEELLRRSIALARASGTVNKLTHSLMIVALEGIFAGRCALAAEAIEGFKLARDAGLRNTASVLCRARVVRGRQRSRRRVPRVRRSGHERRARDSHGNRKHDRTMGTGSRRSCPRSTRGRRSAVGGTAGVAAGSLPAAHCAHVHAGSRRGFASERVSKTRPEWLAAFEGFAEPGAPTWALALAARCRALLSEDADDAEREFTEALRLHARSNRPFDRARTELLYGRALRRQRKRVESREHCVRLLRASRRSAPSPGQNARGQSSAPRVRRPASAIPAPSTS